MKAGREKGADFTCKKERICHMWESEQSGRGKSEEVGGKSGSRQANPHDSGEKFVQDL